MAQIAEQRAYYEARWANGHEISPYALVRLAKILELLALAPHTRTLCDLGCGTGLASGLLGTLYDVCGVDLADTREQQARFPSCSFVTADILNWDHPRAAFDAVVSQEVLEHIPDARQGDYLAVAHALLKPGGALVLTTPNAATMNAIAGGGRTWSDQPIEDWLTRRQLIRLLEAGGFRIRRITSIIPGVGNRGTYRALNSAKLRKIVGKLGISEPVDALACRLGYGLNFAVMALKA